MSDTSGGAGAANDSMVLTNGQTDDGDPVTPIDEKAYKAARKAEKEAEIAAAKAAVATAEDQLKAAKEALAEARKGTD